MPPTESLQLSLDRLRRSADQARGIGMRVTVSGGDLHRLLSELDRLRCQEIAANGGVTAKPKEQKPKRPRDAESVAEVLLQAADEINRNHAALWSQPLADALSAWADETGTTLPDGWEGVLA